MLRNKRLHTITVLIMIIMIVTASCTPPAKTPVTEAPPEKEDISLYFPLKVGSEWVYEGEGNEYAAYTQTVTKSKDNKYQVMVDNGGTRAANIYTVKEDSIVHTYMEGEVYDDKSVLDMEANRDDTIIKLPIEKGNNWASGEDTCEITDISASVTVPAGTFDDCVVVTKSYKESGAQSNYYYKKGVGLVKSEYKTNDGFVVSSLLKSVNISD